MIKNIKLFTILSILGLFLFACNDNETDDFNVGGGNNNEPAMPAETDNVNMLLGNPSGATESVTTPDNFFMERTQYVLSYNSSKGTSNWISWHLNNDWIGSTSRQDDFRQDTDLPTGFYRVRDNDYSNTGFNRGHMCPSADRTATRADNSSTFLMTNIIPQAPRHNQGLWASMENYCRKLVEDEGKELYIIMGVEGEGGTGENGAANTIANERVVVPANIWKVVVILDEGSNDLNRIDANTRVIAVNIPNQESISGGWGDYRISVDELETLVGYDFLSNVSENIQNSIESTTDNGATN